MIEITDASIEGQVKSNAILVVDCYATWCGPCKALSKIIGEIEAELDSIVFGKLDVDANPATSNDPAYHISAVPTMLVFKNGRLAGTVVGMLGKDKLIAEIKRYIQ